MKDRQLALTETEPGPVQSKAHQPVAVIRKGTTGWFTEKHQGCDRCEFTKRTLARVCTYEDNAAWWMLCGPVSGFQDGHPPILVRKSEVAAG